MRIAISMRVVDATGYHERRDALSHDWVRWLEARGHQAFLVPNASREPEQYLDMVSAQAVIFTGGNNFVPLESERDMSELRNMAEKQVLESAINKGLPVLGVCRGLHLINDFFGGSVDPDIANTIEHVASVHDVTLAATMEKFAGEAMIQTNSFHGQGVREDGLGQDLVPFAWSVDDHLVEGLYHSTKPILAMQWHPERDNPSREFDDVIISRFMEQGAFWAA